MPSMNPLHRLLRWLALLALLAGSFGSEVRANLGFVRENKSLGDLLCTAFPPANRADATVAGAWKNDGASQEMSPEPEIPRAPR